MSIPESIIPGRWLDSRDVIDRYEYLKDALKDFNFCDPDDDPEDIEFARSLIQEEIDYLQPLMDEGEQFGSEWESGVSLIPDDDFVRYAEEFADDIGAVDRDAGWPSMFIDWDAAANALKIDYTEIRWQGVSYWAR